MLRVDKPKRSRKISDSAYFVVDFKEHLFVPAAEGGPVFHYGWVPTQPPEKECYEESDFNGETLCLPCLQRIEMLLRKDCD